MKILVCDPVGQDGLDFLTSKGHEVVVLPDITAEKLLETVGDVHGLIVRGRTKVTKEVIAAAGQLKVIGRSGTGVDNIDLPAAQEKKIVVVNAPGANAESVAEHAFAFMLALARNLLPTVTTLKSGVWAKTDFRGMELKGKTLGVLGYGHIGKRVAELGRAFGMEVLVYAKGDDLEAFLVRADIVSLHVPLTDETRGMIGAKELGYMKKTAYLVNTARGAIVDETALIGALKTGTIAGAALDVYATEPLSSSSELLALPNVIVTPHVAADSREGENRASSMIAEDIDVVLSGGRPQRPVNI